MKRCFLALIIAVIFLFIIAVSKEEIKGILNPSSNITRSNEVTLISTGDIGLVRDVNYKILAEKDPRYPFIKIADYLKDADLTVTNLEGPLINNCPVVRVGFTFCGEDSNVSGLTYSGIDAVNLANNHTTNFGLEGLQKTVQVLNSNEITSFGLDKDIKYIQVKDKKIALVGFVELGNNWGGLNNATPENVSGLINSAKQNADIVIVSFHWGTEYTYQPTQNQKFLARLAIDSGSDIVLGNHPHWIQPIEIYKDKIIVYAQGNTVFDQDWSRETREGILYKFVWRNNNFEKMDEKFTIIENNSQPRFATIKETEFIKSKLSP